ncbi:MAG TPA: SPOR domain-containing protein [Methyloversatilis sp.]
MRLAFFILLLINIALYPFVAGLLGGSRDGREPLRMSSQIRPERIRVLASDGVAQPVVAAPQPTVAAEPAGCRMLSGLVREQVDAVAARIREQQVAVQLDESEQTETTSWWVNVPDLMSRQQAERKQAELRALGVRDTIIMADPMDPQKLAVSLGLFKTEPAAKELLSTLAGRGVRSARISPREGKAGRYQISLRGAVPAIDALLAGVREAVGDAAPTECP